MSKYIAKFEHPEDMAVEIYLNENGHYEVAILIPSTNHKLSQGTRNIEFWLNKVLPIHNWKLTYPEKTDKDALMQSIKLDLALSDQTSDEGEDY